MRYIKDEMDWTGIKAVVLEDVPMKRYTSMRVGGPVRYMVYPVDDIELSHIVERLVDYGIGYRFLGNGTNIIVNDCGIKEAVIRITRFKTLGFKNSIKDSENTSTVTVSGGVSLKGFIKDCAKRGLSGLERLYWIPGSVGGAIKMNAGSFGATISDCLEGIYLYNQDTGFLSLAKKDILFGYRQSSVGRTDCVVSARFKLQKRDKKLISDDMDYVYRERRLRHPMEFPSSGSIFKSVGGEPAWRFIEKAGLKGLRIGGACVSEKHANFIVNIGGATAGDIKRLIDKVKQEVLERLGVILEEEVELWGFDN